MSATPHQKSSVTPSATASSAALPGQSAEEMSQKPLYNLTKMNCAKADKALCPGEPPKF